MTDTIKKNSENSLSAVSKLARAELEKFARPGESLTMMISQNDEQHELMLPSEAVNMLMQILEHLTLHKSVSIIAKDRMMTTQEVANVLRVSRPFVTKLIDDGKLSCTMVGSHRRVRFDDLIAYKAKIDANRRIDLDELAAQGQELGMGY